jgi:cold shock CspA family protein
MSRKKKARGILATWFPIQGYGFVTTTEGENVFIHLSEIIDLKTVGSPERGQRLSFTVIVDKGKLRAVRVIRMKGEIYELMGKK